MILVSNYTVIAWNVFYDEAIFYIIDELTHTIHKIVLGIIKQTNSHSGLHVFCVIPESIMQTDTGFAKNANRYDKTNSKTKSCLV